MTALVDKVLRRRPPSAVIDPRVEARDHPRFVGSSVGCKVRRWDYGSLILGPHFGARHSRQQEHYAKAKDNYSHVRLQFSKSYSQTDHARVRAKNRIRSRAHATDILYTQERS